jgi:hypothetical protein
LEGLDVQDIGDKIHGRLAESRGLASLNWESTGIILADLLVLVIGICRLVSFTDSSCEKSDSRLTFFSGTSRSLKKTRGVFATVCSAERSIESDATSFRHWRNI